MGSRRWSFLFLAVALAPGCKNPDDGPVPYVMPAYPVRNLPPLPPPKVPQGAPGEDDAPSVKSQRPLAPAGSTQRAPAGRVVVVPNTHSVLNIPTPR